jgi:hypothetical protein
MEKGNLARWNLIPSILLWRALYSMPLSPCNFVYDGKSCLFREIDSMEKGKLAWWNFIPMSIIYEELYALCRFFLVILLMMDRQAIRKMQDCLHQLC